MKILVVQTDQVGYDHAAELCDRLDAATAKVQNVEPVVRFRDRIGQHWACLRRLPYRERKVKNVDDLLDGIKAVLVLKEAYEKDHETEAIVEAAEKREIKVKVLRCRDWPSEIPEGSAS